MEGVSGATGALLKSTEGSGYKLLGSEINCDEKYTSAVSSALSFFGESYLVRVRRPRLIGSKVIQKKRINVSVANTNEESLEINSETYARLALYGLANPISLADVTEATSEIKKYSKGHLHCRNRRRRKYYEGSERN